MKYLNIFILIATITAIGGLSFLAGVAFTTYQFSEMFPIEEYLSPLLGR